MKVAIAADHAGYEYKSIIVAALTSAGYDVLDLSVDQPQPDDDYPDHAAHVAGALQNNLAERGILICGSSVGVSVAANKFKGIRAGVCHDTYSAHQSVEHDNVNILCLGQRVIGINVALEIVHAFLNAVYSHEARHQRRLGKVEAIESKNFK